MTLMKRISTANIISENLRYLCHPCSIPNNQNAKNVSKTYWKSGKSFKFFNKRNISET